MNKKTAIPASILAIAAIAAILAFFLLSCGTGGGKGNADPAGFEGAGFGGSDADSAAADDRFRQLMDEIKPSLRAVDDASVFSAGSEDVMGYDEEGELE